MFLHLKKPLLFFDLETTGMNITHDRIIEIGMLKVNPNGEKEARTYRLNPTVPISAEATFVHGITNEELKDQPTFNQLGKNLAKFMEGCDLAGYNLIKFDIPLLVEEFLRAEIDFDLKNRCIVDAQKIFHMMEPRTLSAAYKFYCNKSLTNAHSAEADTLATYEVLDAQIEKYADKEVIDDKGGKTTPITNDIQSLHKLSFTQIVDLAGRMKLNQLGVEVFNFGKHKDKAVVDVFKQEPSYFDWMMNGDFPRDTKRKLTEIKLRVMRK